MIAAKHLHSILCTLALLGCTNDSPPNFEKWGNSHFTPERWQAADKKTRAALLHSFMQQRNVIGMKASELKKVLGKSTAYYNYDTFPAYLVGSEEVNSEYGKGYMIAFPIDHSTGLVKPIVVIPPIKD